MESEKILLEDVSNLPQEVYNEIKEFTSQIEELEEQLKEYKKIEESYNDFRAKLYDKMTEFDVKKFTSLNNTQFTIVSGSQEKTEIVLEFNLDKFKVDKPDLYKEYLEQKEKVTKAKAGYLRITTPKGE